MNQAMLKQQLLKRKHRVIVACDGEEGVDAFIKHREEIDVVLMDLAVSQYAMFRFRFKFSQGFSLSFCVSHSLLFVGVFRSYFPSHPFSPSKIFSLDAQNGRMVRRDFWFPFPFSVFITRFLMNKR